MSARLHLDVAVGGGSALTLKDIADARVFSRVLLDALPDTGLIVTDAELRILAMDGGVYARHGYRSDQALGQHVREVLSAESWSVVGEHYEAALHGETRSFDYVTSDRSRAYWVRMAPVPGADGRPGGVLAISQDVTDRLASEATLRRGLAQQSAVAELGQRAATGAAYEDLSQRACDLATETLEADFAGVFELPPDEQWAKLHAACGWRLHEVGARITRDGQRELEAEGAVSGVTVPLLDRSLQFGALAVHSRSPRLFGDDELAFVRSLADVLVSASDRERSERVKDEAIDHLSRFWMLGSHLLAVFGPDECFERVSPGWERILGWAPEEVIGHSWREFVAPEDLERTERVDERMDEDGSLRDFANRYRTKDGGVRWLLWSTQPGPGGSVYCSAKDITDRQLARQELTSARDYLRAVTDNMGEGMLTLDHEGHLTYLNSAGEQLLGWSEAELAGRPLHETIHRCGRDEGSLCRDRCALHTVLTGVEARVEDDAFTRRDGALVPVAYTATPFTSEQGVSGSVVVFRDITEHKASELRLEREVEAMSWIARIHEALAENRFVLYAQPIIDASTGEHASDELLLRMIDGDEVITPSSFLPVAEEYGLIGEIDRWVIARAFELAAAGRSVEFNISASSLGERGILTYFEQQLRATGADPSLVVVEITETALLANEAAGMSFARRLHELGCRLALDDFGTGYGGFSYLTRLPVDLLKIDTEFVRDLPFNPAGRHVVEAVVNLAAGFGQKTVAEGVEDQATLELLRRLGVDYAQGYGIGKPAPI